ncbi:MAG: DNA cytosine methyltransferase [Gallionella sp.]|jgi:DNA (cytosine-5)-methyltransferase 1
MKILNLYAGIGGNRKLWGDEHEIMSVELDPKIAGIYDKLFPQDLITNDDAHKFLLEHFSEYDFIWSSPPCQTHSSFRHNICVRFRGTPPQYPDMRLYQEIIFLQKHFKGKWVVENVQPYYEPLIKPTAKLQRHLFWANFPIADKKFDKDIIRKAQIPDLQKIHGFDLSKCRLKNKRQVLRNCVLPELGKYILDEAIKKGT